ncbi:MAG: phosphatidylglycerophosphatase A, partial [Bacteroidetes bacterium]|nr:phosphatidylglycerophosphatase A [Bacteroidota bacterium]
MFYKLVSSCCGIGLLRGGGTFAALAFLVCWYFARGHGCNNLFSAMFFLLITAIGIWCAGMVEEAWGKDSSKVVIDEAAGMSLSLLFVPVELKYAIAAFVLFRFFDIAKPLYIRRLEKLPRGWGVMADDLLAGVYSNII